MCTALALLSFSCANAQHFDQTRPVEISGGLNDHVFSQGGTRINRYEMADFLEGQDYCKDDIATYNHLQTASLPALAGGVALLVVGFSASHTSWSMVAGGGTLVGGAFVLGVLSDKHLVSAAEKFNQHVSSGRATSTGVRFAPVLGNGTISAAAQIDLQ